MAAKGKAAPLAVWRLRGLQSGAAGLVNRASGLVGRAEELDALRAALERVATAGRAELMIVSGDAGIGKSRLVAELLAEVPAGARCTAHARAMAAATHIARFGTCSRSSCPLLPEGRLTELLDRGPKRRRSRSGS